MYSGQPWLRRLACTLLDGDSMNSPGASVPVLDTVVLTELEVLGADMVGEIVGLFVADVPQRLAKLHDAIAEQSQDAILREAHGLKGSALAVGAARLAGLCAAIEHDARAGLLDRVVAQWPNLEPEFADVRRAFAEIQG